MSDIQDLIHKTSIDCIKQGERQATERIIKLLEEHVWQLDVAPNGKWKQRCRCGFYGVFNEHLSALIKGEQDG